MSDENRFAELPNISPDVRAELEDEDFTGRQHYSRATYAEGCRGPLCRLAETHRGRRRNEERALEAGREYKPNLEARVVAREKELTAVVSWHLHERGRKSFIDSQPVALHR